MSLASVPGKSSETLRKGSDLLSMQLKKKIKKCQWTASPDGDFNAQRVISNLIIMWKKLSIMCK